MDFCRIQQVGYNTLDILVQKMKKKMLEIIIIFGSDFKRK